MLNFFILQTVTETATILAVKSTLSESSLFKNFIRHFSLFPIFCHAKKLNGNLNFAKIEKAYYIRKYLRYPSSMAALNLFRFFAPINSE